jgi:tetratricopeptide (TPR) repeat protein
MTSLAVAAAHLQETASARALYDLLTPHAHQIDMMVTIAGSVAHYLGLLAASIERLDEADAHFAAAAAVHERMGAAPWLARTRLEWARMVLIRRKPGDAEQALDLLGQALETARELGLANIEREAANLLASQ